MAHNDPRWPPIPTQDFSNLPRQQQGLHTKGFEFMRLSNQVEGLISNYHRLIDGYLAGIAERQAGGRRAAGLGLHRRAVQGSRFLTGRAGTKLRTQGEMRACVRC